MFLSKTIADEIRDTFPGKELEPLRLKVREMVRADRWALNLIHEFPQYSAGFRKIDLFIMAQRPCEVCGKKGHNEERHERS